MHSIYNSISNIFHLGLRKSIISRVLLFISETEINILRAGEFEFCILKCGFSNVRRCQYCVTLNSMIADYF